MQKKKFITLAAVLALCLVMTACGTKKAEETPEPSAQISVEQDTGSVTAVLQSGEVSRLDEIENLKEADLRGSECYEEIYEWSKAHPTVAVFYDVTLPDGAVVTGKTSSLLGASAALLLNVTKELAGIDHSVQLIPQEMIEPIQKTKIQYLHGHNPRLHTDEVLVALSVLSRNDENCRKALATLPLLKGCQAHSTVMLKDEDLRIDTYRSGGAGGQHVNKTDSAVRLTHLPTGIVVACQKERSQHMNKEKAMNMLRAQLYEYYEDQKRAEMDRFYGAKSENGWGSQIRSYVFCPYTMVKDLRTEVETSDVNAVMDGHIQPFVEAWLQQQAAKSK